MSPNEPGSGEPLDKTHIFYMLGLVSASIMMRGSVFLLPFCRKAVGSLARYGSLRTLRMRGARINK